MEERIFVEAQDLVDDVTRVAAGEAFEEQRMIPDPHREARSPVGVRRAQTHGPARLPCAAGAFDDV